MAKKHIVMAISHKDLGTSLPEQKAVVVRTAKVIADSIREGWQVAIMHSNAPQTGIIHTVINEFGKQHDGYSRTPMPVCSAMSQSYVSYDLQDDIRAELTKRGVYKPVGTILTQATVDPYDETFYTPVKVIGRVMTAKEAEEEEAEDDHVKEVKGGFRRAVVSLRPIAIVETDTIKALLDTDRLVITRGGGSIPVMEQGHNLGGASAIIEKDLVIGLPAREVDADVTMTLTGVGNVTLNYGTKDGQSINRMTTDQARDYISREQFGFTPMLPKTAASVDFLESGKGRKAITTILDKAKESLKRSGGTVIG